MKKSIFAVLFIAIVSLIALPTSAMAELANGGFDLNTSGGNIEMGGSSASIDGGFTGGGSIAGGFGIGNADSHLYNGDAVGDLTTGGGGIITGHNYDDLTFNFNGGFGAERIIGSHSEAQAVTNGSLKLSVDAVGPACFWDFGRYGDYSVADGNFFGAAGQATGDFSMISPASHFDSNGFSGGIAAQGAVGFIEGSVDVESTLLNGWGEDTDTAAASFNTWGTTDAASWRGTFETATNRTEYMGSRSFAGTNVETSFTDTGHDAQVGGGFTAAGVAANKTVMTANNAMGSASAFGAYSGSGGLGTNYGGSANAISNVSIQTVNGYQGSFVSSTASASVTSGYSTLGD